VSILLQLNIQRQFYMVLYFNNTPCFDILLRLGRKDRISKSQSIMTLGVSESSLGQKIVATIIVKAEFEIILVSVIFALGDTHNYILCIAILTTFSLLNNGFLY